MAVELEYWSIIVPIENINKCKSLGGFQKFIESQTDRIGNDVWYDEYLYRYRIPGDDNEEIFKFWEKEGLQLRNQIVGDSKNTEWKDLCLTTASGPSMTCNWLEVDKDVPCVWLKGKPRGELHGSSNRRKSKVISESTIGEEYYDQFFKRLYKLHKDISSIPEILLKAFNFRDGIEDFRPKKWDPPDNFFRFSVYTLVCFICLILTPITNFIIWLLPKFDANKYLNIFNLIQTDKGYTLDYEYCGNSPVVFTRKRFSFFNILNFKTKDMSDVLGPFQFENIKNISFEQSPEGFLQFAVFRKIINQFYLFWHANTNDLVFIYSKAQIEDILKRILLKEYEDVIREKDIYNRIWDHEIIRKMAEAQLSEIFKNRKIDDDVSIYLGPKTEINGLWDINTGKSVPLSWTSMEELEALFGASLNPQVTIMENGYGVVRILTFSKWGGFVYSHFYIKYPNTIENVYTKEETVLKYSCGIQF